MKKYLLALALLLTAVSVSGCIFVPYHGYGRGGGWCYYHPYRCY